MRSIVISVCSLVSSGWDSQVVGRGSIWNPQKYSLNVTIYSPFCESRGWGIGRVHLWVDGGGVIFWSLFPSSFSFELQWLGNLDSSSCANVSPVFLYIFAFKLHSTCANPFFLQWSPVNWILPRLIWQLVSWLPTKVKILYWLVVHGKKTCCMLISMLECFQQGGEQMGHLFFPCRCTRPIWNRLLQGIGWVWVCQKNCYWGLTGLWCSDCWFRCFLGLVLWDVLLVHGSCSSFCIFLV